METTISDLPFHEWLRRRRRSLDLTIEALANLAGCSPNTLRKLESGDRRPSQQLAMLLAKQLQIPAEQHELFVRYARIGHLNTGILTPLPTSLNSTSAVIVSNLIGRNETIAAVRALLHEKQPRLLSLLGPAGVGKTSLARTLISLLQSEYSDGAAFVELADLHEPGFLPTTIARQLHISGEQSLESLQYALQTRRMLLVLDNFEHLIGSAGFIGDLLHACPELSIITTSRIPLNLHLEQRFDVPPLLLPSPQMSSEQIARSPAVALFHQRVQALVPSFTITPQNAAAVAEICRYLDGLPLAIELIAARTRLLSPQAMLERLQAEDGVGILQMVPSGHPDRPARQQSLYLAIHWSERLLSTAARRMFARLSCLVGEWSLHDAEQIAADDETQQIELLDQLQELVDSNLIVSAPDETGEIYFHMLTAIREYAAAQLQASDEEPRIRRRHAEHFRRVAEDAQHVIRGDQNRLLALLNRYRENFRASLQWAIHQADSTLSAGLGIPLWRYWWISLSLSEGRTWLERILVVPNISDDARGRLLNGLCVILNALGEHKAAQHAGEVALEIVRRTNHLQGMIAILTNLGGVYSDSGDLRQAEACYLEVQEMSEEANDEWSIGTALNNLGNIARQRKEFDLARSRFQAAAAIYQRLDDEHGRAMSIGNLGSTALDAKEYLTAQQYYVECLHIRNRIGDQAGVSHALEALARVAIMLGLPDRAGRLIGAIDILLEILRADRPKQIQNQRRETLALIKQSLSDYEYQTAYTAGRSLSYDDVVIYASSV